MTNSQMIVVRLPSAPSQLLLDSDPSSQIQGVHVTLAVQSQCPVALGLLPRSPERPIVIDCNLKASTGISW